MIAATIRLINGSIICIPVMEINMPATTTPAEMAASAAMCRYAPRMFRSDFRPDMNMNAVNALITTPTAATRMMVGAWASTGCRRRLTASQTIPPMATSRRRALMSAARIDDLRKP